MKKLENVKWVEQIIVPPCTIIKEEVFKLGLEISLRTKEIFLQNVSKVVVLDESIVLTKNKIIGSLVGNQVSFDMALDPEHAHAAVSYLLKEFKNKDRYLETKENDIVSNLVPFRLGNTVKIIDIAFSRISNRMHCYDADMFWNKGFIFY